MMKPMKCVLLMRDRRESSLTISRKPDGAWAGSQLWILKGERSGLLTRIAATGKRFVVCAKFADELSV
jgi:hypothetical protein